MKYYYFKQLPNFILATPIILISIYTLVLLMKNHWFLVFTAGLG